MQINRSTFGILFYFNTSKTKKSGKCPIVGRITADGKNTSFSTGLGISPEQWDAKSELVVGKSKEVSSINQQIEKYQREIEEHYKTLVNDNGYVTNRQKTGTASYIPLLDIPKQILERYKDSEFAGTEGRVFKLQHHVCVNWQLKRLAKATNIDKRLTFHMSRFTFATTVCLTQEVPIESLSQMMGHLSTKTTQIYAEVTKTKIDEDMTNLAKTIEGKFDLSDVPTKKRIRKVVFNNE